MKNIEDKTKRELSELFKLDSKYVDRLIKTNKLVKTGKKGISNLYELKDFKKIIETFKQIPYIEIINDILDLIKKYKEHLIAVPQGLKGDVGELLVMNKLIQKFPDNTSILLGGTFPSIDVLLENKKIQVKTFLNRDDYKKHDFNVEYCPTIRKGFKERCDIVILVELYQTEEYRIDLSKTNYYIFGKSDFKHFNEKGCWSGKSKGDFTIWHVIEPLPEETRKKFIENQTRDNEAILFYDTDEYRSVFKRAKDNWNIIVE